MDKVSSGVWDRRQGDVVLHYWVLLIVVLLVIASGGSADSAASPKETIIDVAPVWAGHPVGFALLTHGDRQFVSFYDAERKLTVGSRAVSENTWHFVKLPEAVGWDSHNFITMALDDEGCIHLCANMHASPLVYFRTTKPGDIDSFVRFLHMTGKNEEKCTYPSFFRGPGNEFLFTYRSGYSGNGEQYYNVYDRKSRMWHRLMDQPLTTGEGHMNAYFSPMRMGPDGYYHMAWVWRDHGGCETNHDVSYARSKDLINWEAGSGRKLELPITVANADIVDPVPPKGGAINGNVCLGFDSQKRVVVSYHKYDEKGFTQIYNARLEQGQYAIYKTSSWDYRWDFSGGGAISFEVGLGPVSLGKDGRLTQSYRHVKYGNGHWILDEATLKPIDDIRDSAPPAHPHKTMEAPDNTLEARRCGDIGSSGKSDVRYELRWETWGVNRDKKRDGTPPPPSMMKLVRIES